MVVSRSRAFTLIELLLVVGIVAVVAAIVIVAVNPTRQLDKAQSIKRLSDSNQLQKALSQYLIDNGSLPDALKIPTSASDAVSICSYKPSASGACIDVDALAAKYLAAIPVDPAEPCSNATGYALYADKLGPHLTYKLDTSKATCPVTITWSNATTGQITGGQMTLTNNLDLTGKTLTVAADGTLSLNGHNVTGNAVVNNGTIAALGTESVPAANPAGSWKITGGNSALPVLQNQSNITNLTLAPLTVSTTYAPTAYMNVTGRLNVGANATFDTTGLPGSSAFAALSNTGAVVLGNNNVTFASYDPLSGQSIIRSSTLRNLAYHDVLIDTGATVTSSVTVNGVLTVNTSKQLTLNQGTTLTAKGNVVVQGVLAGQGTLSLNNGTSVTVANGGLLSGQDASHKLTLSAANAWTFQYGGASPLVTSYLAVTNGNANGAVSCSGCTCTGTNANVHCCADGQVWNGSACATPSTWVWTGNVDSNWSVAGNWNPSIGTPGSSAAVEIPSGVAHTLTLTSSVTVSTLTIDAGATMTIGSAGTLQGKLVNNGTFVIQGTFVRTGDTWPYGNAFVNNGTTTVPGTLTYTDPWQGITNNGSLAMQTSSSVLVIGADTGISNNGTLDISHGTVHYSSWSGGSRGNIIPQTHENVSIDVGLWYLSVDLHATGTLSSGDAGNWPSINAQGHALYYGSLNFSTGWLYGQTCQNTSNCQTPYQCVGGTCQGCLSCGNYTCFSQAQQCYSSCWDWSGQGGPGGNSYCSNGHSCNLQGTQWGPGICQ